MPDTLQLIQAKTLTSNQAAIEFTSIPQIYTDLYIKVSARSTRATFGDIVIRFNNSSSNLVNARFFALNGANGANSSEWTNFSSDAASANVFSNIDFYVFNYATSKYKTWSVDNSAENDAAPFYITMGCGTWENTNAITSLKLFDVSDSSGNNLKTNSTAYLYGVLKA